VITSVLKQKELVLISRYNAKCLQPSTNIRKFLFAGDPQIPEKSKV